MIHTLTNVCAMFFLKFCLSCTTTVLFLNNNNRNAIFSTLQNIMVIIVYSGNKCACCIFKLNMMLKAYFIFTFYFYNFIINPSYPQFKTNTMTMFTNLPIEKNVKISFYCFFFTI